MKRFFYGLLAAVLLIICVPVSVFADGSQERTEIEAEADDADGTFTVENYMNPIVGGATSQDANG